MTMIPDHKSSGRLMPDKQGIERGVRLFTQLVEAASHAYVLGISYVGFLAYMHGVEEFREIAGRNYLPSDSGLAVDIAVNITSAAGGRKEVARSGRSIRAGMDTFIWNQKPPFDRPDKAWQHRRYSIPYTRQQWLSIFPDGARRLITAAELRLLATLPR